MNKLVHLVGVGVLLSVLLTEGQAIKARADRFVVGPGEVLAPDGVFLLVRKGRDIGAVRFANIKEGTEVGTGKARYDSYFPADRSGGFGSRNVHMQTGENELKPLNGIGRLAFQFGNNRVRIGNWSFLSSSPGAVSMWPYRGSQKDYGYEFAPTSAREVGEIDAFDKRLRWFRFSKDSRVTLQVADLPK